MLMRRPNTRKLMSPGKRPSPNRESQGTQVIKAMMQIKITKIQRIGAL